MDQGEVTEVIYDLCSKKGIPCRWGKVSPFFSFFVLLLIDFNRRLPACRHAWAVSRPRQNVKLGDRSAPPEQTWLMQQIWMTHTWSQSCGFWDRAWNMRLIACSGSQMASERVNGRMGRNTCYYYSSTCLIYSSLCQQLHQNTNPMMKKLKLFQIFIYIISYYSFLTFKFYSDFSWFYFVKYFNFILLFSFCSHSRPFSTWPFLELGCWVNDIGADGRNIGNK